MPQITIHVGGREPLEATISKATPMGLLGTEAIVRLGPAMVIGTATPEGAASLLVAALEHAWQTIRQRHPDVPEAALVVASGSEGKRLNWGHFAPHRWHVNGSDRHEVLVGGEGLQRNPLEVLGTLLHEAAHGLAQARGLQDTSRGGRYHNSRGLIRRVASNQVWFSRSRNATSS